MRRLAIVLPVVLLLVVPANAADQSVRATPNNTFSPSTVTIAVGDTVTFNNDGGIHNVKFEDGKFEQPPEPSFAAWRVSRTFDAPGDYRYFCEQHGSSGGAGMSGRVIVEGSQPPPPAGEQPDTTPPDIDNLRIRPSTFCNRKTSKCKRVGTVIEFTIDEDAKVSGRIVNRKTGKKAGSVSITASRGEAEFDYSGKGLKLGKYRLELTPRDAAGNKASKPTRANFTVATSRR